MYFCIAIWTQSPVPLIRFHTFLGISDLENNAGNFNPQPPKDFGFSKTFHEDQGKPIESLLPDHKNLKQIFLILSRIPIGIQKSIQYTGMASRTDFTNISFPPLDSHL